MMLQPASMLQPVRGCCHLIQTYCSRDKIFRSLLVQTLQAPMDQRHFQVHHRPLQCRHTQVQFRSLQCRKSRSNCGGTIICSSSPCRVQTCPGTGPCIVNTRHVQVQLSHQCEDKLVRSTDLCRIDKYRISTGFCHIGMFRCSSCPCNVDTSRSSKGSSCPDTSR